VDITLDKLESLNACAPAITWLKNQHTTDIFELYELLKKTENLEWGTWIGTRLMTRSQKIKFAIFADEQVLHIFENKYPNDKRPRLAIDAARAYLDDPTLENKNAAAYAAYAAAADAADAADAKKKMQIKILDYGLKLIKGGNNETDQTVKN
jgi:hypothetical protein